MRRRVSGIGRNVVIEITEEEDLDLEILNMKRRSTVLSGLYALDDYGSGYSNEGNLITLDPDFIKIDISIIRGIESDPNKQEVVRNIVSYAHQRGMQIVAEGIETAAELRTSRALGADLFQGYFLSRPGAVPSDRRPGAGDPARVPERRGGAQISTEEILGKTYKKNSENCTKDIVKKSTIPLYILPLMLYSDNRSLCPHARRHYKDKSPPQSFF